MTRRERMEARIERRREWADSRRAKAAPVLAERERYRGDHAFNTQPGHIPERARLIRREDKMFENLAVADHHESKAAGLERQLDRTIFSDDDNAVEALAAKASRLNAEADRCVAINREARKGSGWSARLEPRLTEAEGEALAQFARFSSGTATKPIPSYHITNLRANARRCEERIKFVQAQQERSAQAETAGGVVVEGDEWVRVTFAEKPEREVINALKAAGFRWGGGSWVGKREALPECMQGGSL